MFRIELFITYAMSLLHTPYIWGGNNALEGLDCSGFVQECLSAIGMDKKGDQSAQMLFNYFNSTAIGAYNFKRPMRGNLLFFGKDRKNVTHVAIAYDSEHMLEAGGGDSTCKTVEDAKKLNAMIRIRPISNRRDLLVVMDIF